MKFSIVIPLYNKQDYIERAINSVLNQLGNNDREYEVIVVDDGSVDDSLAIVKRIQQVLDHDVIKVFSHVNSGVSATRNKGIELASADYIAFLDADDTYEPHFLNEIEGMINAFAEAAMLATAYCFVDTATGAKRVARIAGITTGIGPQRLNDFFHSAANGDLPVTSSSVCINKRALKSVGGFPEGENMGEDQAVWSQIALKYPVVISPEVCANYFEDNASSLMQTVSPSDEMPFSKRLQRQLNQNDIGGHKKSSIKQYVAAHLLDLVRRNIQAGDLIRARALLSDRRARSQFKRWVFWSLKLHWARIRQSVQF